MLSRDSEASTNNLHAWGLGEEVTLPVCFGKRFLNDCAKLTPVPSRVGVAKA